jgi:hypothetical protein
VDAFQTFSVLIVAHPSRTYCLHFGGEEQEDHTLVGMDVQGMCAKKQEHISNVTDLSSPMFHIYIFFCDTGV